MKIWEIEWETPSGQWTSFMTSDSDEAENYKEREGYTVNLIHDT